jgi:LysM repeat protein
LFDIEEISMARIKRGIMIASTLMLVVVITSACKTPYSQAPAVTFTPVQPNNLFASAQPTTMGDISSFATGSAIAQLITTPGTPAPSATVGAGITPLVVTATNTPLVSINPTSTATLAVSNNSGPTATLLPAGAKPPSYTLQNGEFIYCIARRFNVDPDEVLALNGLADSQTIYSGLVIKIPQSGKPFPGSRMWHNHPDTYTVDSSSETVYGVACYYGDIDPALIAQANGISVGASLSTGQQLKIP